MSSGSDGLYLSPLPDMSPATSDCLEPYFSVFPLVKLQLRTRFIHVGVDTSRYALLIGGRSSYPLVLVKLLCLDLVYHVCVIWYMFSGYI